MGRVLLCAVALASLLFPAAQKRNQQRPPEVEVLEMSVRRESGKIGLDGRVRNSGERPAVKLQLLFDFMAPGRQVITTKRGGIEEEVLEPGQEAEFHLELVDPVRAVECRLNAAEEGNGRELKVVKGGPFPIE